MQSKFQSIYEKTNAKMQEVTSYSETVYRMQRMFRTAERKTHSSRAKDQNLSQQDTEDETGVPNNVQVPAQSTSFHLPVVVTCL